MSAARAALWVRPPGLGLQPLRWAMGGLCAALGSLLLVAPHRFAAPLPAAAGARPGAWGAVALAAGVGLLAVAVLRPDYRFTWAAHLLGGGTLLALAASFASAEIWIATITYVLLGLGLLATAAQPSGGPPPGVDSRDLFTLLLGLMATVNGTALLAWRQSASAGYFDPSRSRLPWVGALLLLSGVALVGSELWHRRPRPVSVAAHLLAAGAFFVFGSAVSLPGQAYTALAFNWGYALAIGLVPWLGRHPSFGSPPLQVRLAFLLATGVCLALILTSALVTVVVAARAGGLADAAVREGRDAVLVLLLLVMPLAIGGGVVLARRIARPLGTLASAVGVLERSEGTLGVGSTGIAEIDHLTAAFADLRQRLAERTAESERLARELRGRADALAEADRRKDEFLAMLGHELRNPLGAIVSSTTLLHERGLDGSLRQRALAIIERQTQVLVRLVDDLLDVSRITRGKVNLQLVALDLREVVLRAIEVLRPQLDGKRHALAVDLPAEPLTVHGDSTRLEQVIGNLLANAVKYTPPGGHLAVSVARCADGAVLAVRDDGAGIPGELLPRVFDLFVQGEQALDRAASGLGIGLTLVQQVVALHGGRVEARSEGPGKGTEMQVLLPLATEPAADTASAASVTTPAAS